MRKLCVTSALNIPVFAFLATLVVPLSHAWADDAESISAVKPVVSLGTRWELFVDKWLLSDARNAALKLHAPERREVVLTTDAPWEGISSAYFSVVQDGNLVRLYYRGSGVGSDLSEEQVTCVADSHDGVHFTRPKLGIIDTAGTKDNNIVWKGIESHNFAPFLDKNPACKPEERYKALAGISHPGRNWQEGDVPAGLFAFASADGVHWKKVRKEPVITKGAFDSLNLAFWNPIHKRYDCYSRIFTNGVRAIQSSHSADFMNWSDGVPNHYADGIPFEHFYTNATVPCPGAEHILLSFPKRFEPERKVVGTYREPGVSDAVFMSSRDGVNWNRMFLEAWVRPGHDEKNWTDRNNMPAWGIAETGLSEWSMYISEHYQWPDNRLRRLVMPRHRIASMSAGAGGGEFTTRPITFTGTRLVINYATSAVGSVQVEIQDETGNPLSGYELASAKLMYGDELEAPISWKAGDSLSSLTGTRVRLKFVLKDADVFALRFEPAAAK